MPSRKKQKLDNGLGEPPNVEQELDIPVIDGLDVTAIRDALLASNKEEREELLRYLMESCGIQRIDLVPEHSPGVSSASWAKACLDFGLSSNNGPRQLAYFDVPDLYLPPSVHKRMLMTAMRSMDVYQEVDSYNNEAAHFRLFEAWHVPICQLFNGRIVDKPEGRSHKTTLTSGSCVEHELFVLDLGLIMLVHKLKHHLNGPMGEEEAAQVFTEMHTAWTVNSKRNLRPQPPVYALLTDLEKFIIFKHDGKTFTRLSTMSTCATETRYEFLSSMMSVTERLFSVLLHGFIQYLEAVRGKLESRGKMRRAPRQSIKHKWHKAHKVAVQARDALIRPAVALSQKDTELKGQNGLNLLSESVSWLEKIGSLTEWEEAALDEEMQKLLDGYFPL